MHINFKLDFIYYFNQDLNSVYFLFFYHFTFLGRDNDRYLKLLLSIQKMRVYCNSIPGFNFIIPTNLENSIIHTFSTKWNIEKKM